MPSPSNTVELRVELHWPDDLQAWLNDAARLGQLITANDWGRIGTVGSWDHSITALLWLIDGATPATKEALMDRALEDEWPIVLLAPNVDLAASDLDVDWNDEQ